MKKFLLFITCLPVLSHIIYGQDIQARLDSLVKQSGERFLNDKQAVGLSIGISHNGKTYFYNFGTSDKDRSSSPTQHTIYEIGSITKTFESFVLAHAVMENKVKLDDDIRKYLKESYPNLEYDGHPIQLVHLANTTSLLPDWLPALPAAMKNLPADSALALKIKFYGNFTRQDLFKALHQVQLDTIPGTKRYHSNAGAQLLAYILEDIYGMSMEQLIKKYITHPNGMKETAFVVDKKSNHLAKGYTASGKEAVFEFVMPYFKYAGSLGSSTHDLVNYIGLLLKKNNPASALCLKKTVDVDASSGKVVPLQPDSIANPKVYSAALSWFSYKPDVSAYQIWADGGTNGFNSYLVMYPYLNSGVVLLANKANEKIFRALPGLAYEISKMLNGK